MLHLCSRFKCGYRQAGAAYLLLTLALLPFPLTGLLHVESAAILAFAAYFIAGLSALVHLKGGESVPGILWRQMALLLIPLAILTLSLLWRANCGYFQGVMFFALFPVVTVVFAVAVAAAVHASGRKRKRLWLISVGLLLALIGPVYDLGFHPQFYTYNHVFGGVLGPIYDEELAIRPGLFWFRGITLLWAALLMLLARRRQWRAVQAGVALAIVGLYAFSPQLGINTTHARLQRALPGHLRTAHFDLHYDPSALPLPDARWLALEHEYRYRQLEQRLQVNVAGRIQSYIYPDPEVKARLTGARYTSVAPVWLATPQTHVLQEVFEPVFPHELVHVFSREFGLPVLNASLSVGLIEGLAVALEPPEGDPSPDEQVLAAVVGTPENVGRDLVASVASRLTPTGFWTGRGAVSYTTMGSFVSYLLEAYGPERLKQVYAASDFEQVYGKRAETLATEWMTQLYRLPVQSSASGPVAAHRFGVLSLFEKRCPHYISLPERLYRRATDAIERGDTTAARSDLDRALRINPMHASALVARAQLWLATDSARAVIARLDTSSLTPWVPSLSYALADACARTGRARQAQAWYDSTRAGLTTTMHASLARVILRRASVGQPELVRVLSSGVPPEQKVALLAAFSETPGTGAAWRALTLLDAGEYLEAGQVLPQAIPTSLSPGDRALVERAFASLAGYAFTRAGAYDEALAMLERARSQYWQAGDVAQTRVLDDLISRVRWLKSGRSRF